MNTLEELQKKYDDQAKYEEWIAWQKSEEDKKTAAMTQRNAGKIAIVGFKKADLTKAITTDEIAEIVGILESANRIIVEDSKKGKPKRILFTVEGATDTDLMKLTDDFVIVELACFKRTILLVSNFNILDKINKSSYLAKFNILFVFLYSKFFGSFSQINK